MDLDREKFHASVIAVKPFVVIGGLAHIRGIQLEFEKNYSYTLKQLKSFYCYNPTDEVFIKLESELRKNNTNLITRFFPSGIQPLETSCEAAINIVADYIKRSVNKAHLLEELLPDPGVIQRLNVLTSASFKAYINKGALVTRIDAVSKLPQVPNDITELKKHLLKQRALQETLLQNGIAFEVLNNNSGSFLIIPNLAEYSEQICKTFSQYKGNFSNAEAFSIVSRCC